MPKFTYHGETEWLYPALGLLVQPGETHDLQQAPDKRWGPAEPPKPRANHKATQEAEE